MMFLWRQHQLLLALGTIFYGAHVATALDLDPSSTGISPIIFGNLKIVIMMTVTWLIIIIDEI